MFTVEIKINGSLIGHIYGRNIGQATDLRGPIPDYCEYNYEYYEPEIRKIIQGRVQHARDDGIRELISIILNDVNKQKEKERKKK